MRHSLYKYYDDQRWANQFLDGELLFRPLSYFRGIEQAARGDPNEGASVFRPDRGLVIHNQTQGTITTLPNSMFLSSARYDEIFLFCMSRARTTALVDEFGAVVCIEVTDIPRFRARVQAALPSSATFLAKRVEYYDEADGPGARWALPERIATSKFNTYSKQQEFRFVFTMSDAFKFENVETKLVQGNAPAPPATNAKPFMLSIGSVIDLCRVWPA